MKHGNIIWFEIPVKDLDRASSFYSEILGVPIEKRTVYHNEYGIFNKEKTGIGGSLVKKADYVGKGITLFFFVDVLSDTLDIALASGGKLVTPKTLLKQIDANGNTILAHNLIDDQVGYYAEILDSEGNQISLYSHY